MRSPRLARTLRAIALVAALLAGGAAPVRAQESGDPPPAAADGEGPAVTVKVEQPLLEGVPRAPYPVRVVITAGEAPVRGVLVASERALPRGPRVERPVQLPAGSTMEFWLFLRPPEAGDYSAELRLYDLDSAGLLDRARDETEDETAAKTGELEAKGPAVTGVLWRQRIDYRLDDAVSQHVLVLGDRGIPVPEPKPPEPATEDEPPQRPMRNVVRLRPAQCPPEPRAFDGFDVVVLAADAIDELPPGALEALVERARRGGTLIVGAGRSIGPLRAAELADALPLTDLTSAPGRPIAALHAFLEQSVEPPPDEGALLTTGEPRRGARVIAATPQGAPMVTAAAHGAGEVILVGAPIDAAPLNEGAASRAFWERLLPVPPPPEPPADLLSGFMSGDTTLDAEHQLHDRLVEVSPSASVGAWWLLLGLVLYVAAVGPLDYLLVVRKLRRPMLTWVTFPAIVLAFGAIAYGSARSRVRAGVTGVAATIIEADAEGRPIRGVSWVSLASPANHVYELRMDRPRSAITPSLIEASRMLVPDLRDRVTPEADGTERCRLPIRVGSRRTVRVDWSEPGRGGRPLCEIEAVREAGELVAVRVKRVDGGPRLRALRVRVDDRVYYVARVSSGLDQHSFGDRVTQPDPDELLVELRSRFEVRSEELYTLMWSYSYDATDFDSGGDATLTHWLCCASLGTTGRVGFAQPPGLRDLDAPSASPRIAVAAVVEAVPDGLLVDERPVRDLRGLTCVRAWIPR